MVSYLRTFRRCLGLFCWYTVCACFWCSQLCFLRHAAIPEVPTALCQINFEIQYQQLCLVTFCDTRCNAKMKEKCALPPLVLWDVLKGFAQETNCFCKQHQLLVFMTADTGVLKVYRRNMFPYITQDSWKPTRVTWCLGAPMHVVALQGKIRSFVNASALQ